MTTLIRRISASMAEALDPALGGMSFHGRDFSYLRSLFWFLLAITM